MSPRPQIEHIRRPLASLIDGLAVQVALGDRIVSAAVMRSTCLEVAERLLDTKLDGAMEEAAA